MTGGPAPAQDSRLGSRIAALVVYSAGMGWLEAVVVVYIRALLGIAHAEGEPDMAGVLARMRAVPWLMPAEQGREIATLVMLAGVAWLASRRWLGRLGAFLICFGIWDITYYVGLHALIGWPKSLTDMDVLFLIPPSPLWHQPVWVPVLISCGMVAGGLRIMGRKP